MKQTIFGVSITMLLLTNNLSFVQAQDIDSTQREQSLSFYVGMGNIMRQDLNFSPFVHQDWSPAQAVLLYERSGKLNQMAYVRFGQFHDMIGESFDFFLHFNTAESTALPHTFTVLDLAYNLGKECLERDALTMTIGGGFRNYMLASDYVFGDAGSFSYFFSQSLNVWLHLSYQISENQEFTANLLLPVAAYNSRSPYNSQDDQYFLDIADHKDVQTVINFLKRGEWQSWGTSQVVDLQLAYDYQMSKKWNLGLSYWLTADWNQTPRPYIQIMNMIYVTGKYTI